MVKVCTCGSKETSSTSSGRFCTTRGADDVTAATQILGIGAPPQTHIGASPQTHIIRWRRERMHSVASEIHYPMYAMQVSDFLERYEGGSWKLEAHQLLVELGLVVRVPAEDKEVLFISHEWAGHEHPDPDGAQRRELCLFLRRLCSGEVCSIESSGRRRCSTANTVVGAAEWVERMKGAWLCSSKPPPLTGDHAPTPIVILPLRAHPLQPCRDRSYISVSAAATASTAPISIPRPLKPAAEPHIDGASSVSTAVDASVRADESEHGSSGCRGMASSCAPSGSGRAAARDRSAPWPDHRHSTSVPRDPQGGRIDTGARLCTIFAIFAPNCAHMLCRSSPDPAAARGQ